MLFYLEFRERKRECAIGAALVREPLRERERHAAAVVEAAAAGAQLLQLHGLGARGERRGQPQRRPDRHEQHGALAGAAARLLLLRMTRAPAPRRARARAAHLTLPSRSFLTFHLYISDR